MLMGSEHKVTGGKGHQPKLSLMGFLLCPMGKCGPILGIWISRHKEPRVVVLVVNYSVCLFVFNLEKVDCSAGPIALQGCFELQT